MHADIASKGVPFARRLTAAGSAKLRAQGYPTQIITSEYDAWPRGRVIHEPLGNRFVIYADRRLQRPETIAVIVEAFGLASCAYVIRSDAHYRASDSGA